MGTIGRETWNCFHDLPGHGTIVGGAVGLGAAMLVGVAELATACFTAYVSYRIFAYGESLSEAVEKAIKFEEGKLERKERDKRVFRRREESVRCAEGCDTAVDAKQAKCSRSRPCDTSRPKKKPWAGGYRSFDRAPRRENGDGCFRIRRYQSARERATGERNAYGLWCRRHREGRTDRDSR